jgi:hypothetical protein
MDSGNLQMRITHDAHECAHAIELELAFSAACAWALPLVVDPGVEERERRVVISKEFWFSTHDVDLGALVIRDPTPIKLLAKAKIPKALADQ